jgi:ribosome-associated protein
MLKIGRTEIPDSELRFEFARSGGPGGQNVNKVETKVTVRFTPRTSAALTPPQVVRIESRLAARLTNDGELLVSSGQTRHREQNREDALARLAELLRNALKVQKKRRPTRPTKASKERRIEGKKERAGTKRLRRPPEGE